MILTCPDCATRYFVDDAKLGAEGRTVRCSKCGVKWKAEAEHALELVHSAEEGAIGKPVAAKAAEDAKPQPLPKVFRQREVEKKTLRKAVVHGVVWAVMLAIVGGLAAAAAIFRVDVVRLIPRTAGAYATVGMPVNPTGLVFEKITARPSLEDGHSALIVSGSVRNVEHRTVTVPPIRIEILDEHGKAVAHNVTTPEDPHLKPGETRHFVISLRDPPATAKDVEVAFMLDRAHAPKQKAHGEPEHHAAPATEHHEAPPAPALRGPAEEHHEEPVHAPAEAPHAEEHAPAPPPAPAHH